MITRGQFIDGNISIAICGQYVGGDAIHVGLVWTEEAGDRKVVHFQNGQSIPTENLNQTLFTLFCPLQNFNKELIPSLSALSDLISNNKLNGFQFYRNGVIYNGGRFKINTGNYTIQHPSERIVNCGVFVVGLLMTYEHQLIAWETWPNSNPVNNTYLEQWFNQFQIPQEERDYYFQTAKEIRGKHIIVSPETPTQPSPYNEAHPASEVLIQQLNPA